MSEKPEHSIADLTQLDDMLSEPTNGVVDLFKQLDGDIVVLGAGGKMGPSLSRMSRRASDAAGAQRRVIAVSRLSNTTQQTALEAIGVVTIKADLLDPTQLNALPDASNVIYMAGMKFGSTSNTSMMWAMNTVLPENVCRKYCKSRIVAFSTGNVYGLSPVIRGGSVETDALEPLGEYARSCVGRERVFEHFSSAQGAPVTLLRLNYATEVRYGVLVDLATKVWRDEPIPLEMGAFNAIWQGDANAMALSALGVASSPAFVLNVAGPEVLSVRRVCEELGRLMNRRVTFTGCEAPDALLSNGQLGHDLFGYPRIPARRMIHWIADWVMRGQKNANKPTHFEARDGNY